MSRLASKNALAKPLTDAAKAVFAGVTITAQPAGGWYLYLNCDTLERALYVEVNEALTRMGGKWKGGKVAAHVFDFDPAGDVATMRQTGIMTKDNPLDFFATPAPLAHEIISEYDALDIQFGPEKCLRILEPSAGEGVFIDAIISELGQYRPDREFHIVAIEADKRRAGKLRDKYKDAPVEVIEADFLTCDLATLGAIDRVIMNPPFTSEGDPAAWITHILHAHTLLSPAGQMVAIVPSGFEAKSGKRFREFQEFHREYGGTVFKTEPNAFKESGTGVNATVLRISSKEDRADTKEKP